MLVQELECPTISTHSVVTHVLQDIRAFLYQLRGRRKPWHLREERSSALGLAHLWPHQISALVAFHSPWFPDSLRDSFLADATQLEGPSPIRSMNAHFVHLS